MLWKRYCESNGQNASLCTLTLSLSPLGIRIQALILAPAHTTVHLMHRGYTNFLSGDALYNDPSVKRVRPRAPPSEEGRQTNCLDNTGNDAGKDNVHGALLGQDLAQVAGGTGSEKDQCSEVSGALVRESTGGVDEGADAVGAQARADKGRAPGNACRAGLLRLEELLGGVGVLGALEGVTEDGLEDYRGVLK